MLPAHKSLVEGLYREQLMKVVFATETLAAGINMPARTTVICAMAKRGGGIDGSSMNLLETSNLVQMAGRAGRRGMDTDGTCVLVATPFESHEEAIKILTDPVKPISSQFRPSFSLAVNLIVRGEGKLDVARQLVSKSFAMWEQQQQQVAFPEEEDEGVIHVLQLTAQERFIDQLVDVFQLLIEKRSAKLDLARLEALLEILTDRERLKQNSKSFLGVSTMLELERTTLGYLEREHTESMALTAAALKDDDDLDILGDLKKQDEQELLNQIDVQRKNIMESEKDVNRHPFTVITDMANSLMQENTTEALVLSSALRAAKTRLGDDDDDDEQETQDGLTTSDLAAFAKSAIVVRRKARKLANGQLDAVRLKLEAEPLRNDAWSDMLYITKTLLAYGCLTMDIPFTDDIATLEKQQYTLTAAGDQVGMLGFENSLWSLAAMGGAWDVMSASSKLDKFRDGLEDNSSGDWYSEVDENRPDPNEISKPQQEAQIMVSALRSLSASEIAGYVSSFVCDSYSRGNGPSVVDQFQRLTPSQQRVIQYAFLAMERLTEVQNLHSMEDTTRNCDMYVLVMIFRRLLLLLLTIFLYLVM
jgi:hypothetical protein